MQRMQRGSQKPVVTPQTKPVMTISTYGNGAAVNISPMQASV